MMLPKDQRIPVLHKGVKDILNEFSKSYTVTAFLKERSDFILLAAEGLSNQEIAEKRGCHPHTVSKWRRRFVEASEELNKIASEVEQTDDSSEISQLKANLRQDISTILSDKERSGAPSKFSLVVVFWIICICCHQPSDFGLEASQWSLTLIQMTVIKLGIVENISIGGIYHILSRYDLRPWKNSYYLNSPDKYDDYEGFTEKIRNINLLYHLAKLAYNELDENNEDAYFFKGQTTLEQLKEEIRKIQQESLISLLKIRQSQLIQQEAASNGTKNDANSSVVETASAERVNDTEEMPRNDEKANVELPVSEYSYVIKRNLENSESVEKTTNSIIDLHDSIEEEFQQPTEQSSSLNARDTVKEIRHNVRLNERLNNISKNINLSYEFNKDDNNDEDIPNNIFNKTKKILTESLPTYQESNLLALYSFDEKTGIQALELIHPSKPSLPGIRGKVEFEYHRHGTVSITPYYNIVTGKIDYFYINQTRTEDDMAFSFFNVLAINKDKAKIVFVCDNLNTHMSEAIVRIAADFCGITEDLGKKGVRGILKDKDSRAEFLSDPTHRVYFIFTPKHCSWVNIVEVFFSIMSRRLLKNKNSKSLNELIKSIKNFVDQYNKFFAHPFNWKYNSVPEQNRIDKKSLLRGICDKISN